MMVLLEEGFVCGFGEAALIRPQHPLQGWVNVLYVHCHHLRDGENFIHGYD